MRLILSQQPAPNAAANSIRILVVDAEVQNELGLTGATGESGKRGGDGNNGVFKDELFGKSFSGFCDASAAFAGQLQIDSATRGKEAYNKVVDAVEAGHPYTAVFVDMRKQLGWGRFKDIERMWRADYDLAVVICTDTYDHPWERILGRLGNRDNFLIIAEPFAPIAVMQITKSLICKKKLSAEVKLAHTELEYTVQARTHELAFTRDVLQEANRALTDAKQEAERANREKSESLGTLFRQLQTPINKVLDLAEILETSDLSAEQRLAVESIVAAGNTMLAFVNEVLDSQPKRPMGLSRVA
jgi:hypothetical protein